MIEIDYSTINPNSLMPSSYQNIFRKSFFYYLSEGKFKGHKNILLKSIKYNIWASDPSN